MTDRIIDISDRPAKLSVRNGLMVIHTMDMDEVTVPLGDVGVLIVAHRQVVYTSAVLSELAAAGGVFIACDAQHLPVGMLLPLVGHHLQTERLARQAQAPIPTSKRLWKQIVQAKIVAQGHLLFELHRDDQGLVEMAKRVRSGDPVNLEAQAARRYWRALFQDKNFRRDRDANDQNRHLNYGYGVLRAMVGRAICAAGLHPSLGIHHHNRYNAFCLADDLMEPFRPLVDRAVSRLVWEHGSPDAPFDRNAKGRIIGALMGRVRLGDEQRTLFESLTRVATSLARVFEKETTALVLPEIIGESETV